MRLAPLRPSSRWLPALLTSTCLLAAACGDDKDPIVEPPEDALFSFEVTSIEASEVTRTIGVAVLRSRSTDGVDTVYVRIAPGTATPAEDYVDATRMAVFAEGDTRKEISLVLFQDETDEEGETLSLELFNPSSGIVDEDRASVDVVLTDLVPDFLLPDVNSASPLSGQDVSPRQFAQKISAWYFGHAT